MEKYILKNGKKLRYGYTTGSCAAAAAKGATFMLFNDKDLEKVKISTPKGWDIYITIEDIKREKDRLVCAVKKDGGDDPDVTTGLLVYAEVKENDTGTINISAGEGIGVVTKPGLQVKPGNPAINPVPMKMIIDEVKSVMPQGKGVDVKISIPGGEEVAKRTFNPRLGIKGGISILGTSGIVEPMSCEALKGTLTAELSVQAARKKTVVLVPGNYGKKFARKLGFIDEDIISYGNYLGHVLDKAVELEIDHIILIGDIGKLIKVSAGIFDTTGRVADARREALAAYAGYFGATREDIGKVLYSNTTDDALSVIEKTKIPMEDFYKFIVKRIKERCEDYTFDKVDFKIYLVSNRRGFLSDA